jgi:hypothetical protein
LQWTEIAVLERTAGERPDLVAGRTKIAKRRKTKSAAESRAGAWLRIEARRLEVNRFRRL